VDIVLFGHLHSYDRSWPLKAGKVDLENGVIYIQSGGAGGNLVDFDPVHTWFSREKARGFHYLMFNVYKNTLSGAMYDIDGSMRDTFEISK
jgi:hypothetical protein